MEISGKLDTLRKGMFYVLHCGNSYIPFMLVHVQIKQVSNQLC